MHTIWEAGRNRPSRAEEGSKELGQLLLSHVASWTPGVTPPLCLWGLCRSPSLPIFTGSSLAEVVLLFIEAMVTASSLIYHPSTPGSSRERCE